jgi:hypothetical protein
MIRNEAFIFFLITFGMKNWLENFCASRIDEGFWPIFHSKRDQEQIISFIS